MFNKLKPYSPIIIPVGLSYFFFAVYLFSGGSNAFFATIGCWLFFAAPLIGIIFFRKKIRRLFLAGNLAFLIFLGGIEIGLRVGPLNFKFMPMGIGKNFRPNDYLFWLYKGSPDEETPTISAGSDEPIRFVFRTGPAQKKKDPALFRIVVMGGSNAWGMGVDQVENTLTGYLEKWAKERFLDRRFEFILGAGHGYCLFQNLVLYKLVLRQYNPDLIIYYGNVNDWPNDQKGPYTYRELFKMTTDVDISNLWITQFDFPKKSALKWKAHGIVMRAHTLLRNLRTYNALVKGIVGLRNKTVGADYFAVPLKQVNSMPDYERNLSDLLDITQKDRVPIVLCDAFNYFDANSPRPVHVWTLMQKVAKKRNVPYIPVHELLAKEPDPENLVQTDDKFHLNSSGHKHVARIIFNVLQEKSLLEPGSKEKD